jgi:hypothetical protein
MRIFAMAAVALLVSGPASAAQWAEYRYEDLGIAKEWPNPPTQTAGEYTTPVVGTVPSTEFHNEEDNIVFHMTIVETQNMIERASSIFGECVGNAEREGTPLANMTNRVEGGADAIYGRLVSVDLANNGGRKQTACLFSAGRLYIISATVLPEHGQPNSSMVIRFTNSLSFDLAGYH